ncbi:MAG TPA: hypothetical protein VJO54_05515 [Burkholderiales bacterium]|nr:hypothetical protein [Burkholderiales bacterium]
MTKGRTLLAPLALIALAGCGTLFTGTTDEIKFSANIPGVHLTIDKEPKGDLPLTVVQSRGFMNGETFTAKFEARGYETQEFRLKRQFNWVAVLDITSIPTSGGIDFLTGSLMHFEPREYHIQMEKKGKGAAELERERRAWSYALVNYRKVQKDLARGGGEYLDSFAAVVSGPQSEAGSAIAEHALRHARALLGASSPHDFVRRFNGLLAGRPGLQAYRI